jgi:capsular polysaccharide transport system permease protein
MGNNMKHPKRKKGNTFLNRSFRVFAALMIREMITRYGRSWGGYIWALVEPVSGIVMISVVISQFVPLPAYGNSFLLFFATGFLPFYFFINVSNQVGTALAVNTPLLQLPMVRPLDVILARFALTALTLVVVSTIILGFLALTMQHGLRFDAGSAVAAAASASALGLGIGSLNAVVFSFLPVWKQVWGLLTAPLMVLSGVFYSFGSMPTHIQDILSWNPVVHSVGLARAAVYPGYPDSYVDLTYVFSIALGTFLLALALMLRHQASLIDHR